MTFTQEQEKTIRTLAKQADIKPEDQAKLINALAIIFHGTLPDGAVEIIAGTLTQVSKLVAETGKNAQQIVGLLEAIAKNIASQQEALGGTQRKFSEPVSGKAMHAATEYKTSVNPSAR